MVALAAQFEPFLDWLLRTTVQASFLACIILALRGVLGNRLGVRWRHCLWLILLVRMAMPWAPPSRVSLYSLLPDSPLHHQQHESSSIGIGLANSTPAVTNADLSKTSGPVDLTAGDATGATQTGSHGTPERFWLGARTRIVLASLWLAGACALAGYIIMGSGRLWYRLRHAAPVTDPKVLAVLEGCRRQMGLRKAPMVIATDKVCGPGLFGFLRPRLLLPLEMLDPGDRTELRYIFLHELAHLKRHDLLIAHIASAVHVLHWFNPLLTLGLRQMRADRELVCDALALSLLDPTETPAYGRTIVEQIERLVNLRYRPVVIGLGGGPAQLKQRVSMIVQYRREMYRWSALSILLTATLACVSLSDRRQTDTPISVSPEFGQAIEPDGAIEIVSEYPHVMRIRIRHIEDDTYLVAQDNGVTTETGEPGETGLWEAHFDDADFTPTGDMLIRSVATGKFLKSDGQGQLTLSPTPLEEGTRWQRDANPLGVQVISRDFPGHYLRLDEQGRTSAVGFGRDIRSQWDIMQLERVR